MLILRRDDDINVYTDAFEFKRLHQQFIDKKTEHTVAVVMKDIWENHALFWYLVTAPYLTIGLHGWEHKDYSLCSYEENYADLSKSMQYWYENSYRMTGISKHIDTFFAPWNKESDSIRKACADLGLKFCNVKKGIWEGKQVNSFHGWYAVLSNGKL